MPRRARLPVLPAPILPALPIAATALVALTRAARGVPAAVGAPRHRLRAAAEHSPHARDGVFANTEPATAISAAMAPELVRRVWHREHPGRPSAPVPLVPGMPGGPAADLAVTWFGHSSVLLEVDGHRVLADPVWSDRVSPSRVLGPRRMHPVPAALQRLPPVDAVLISHDHYDHLDVATVRALVGHTDAPFVVPVGIGEHLRTWGVPDRRIVERDWGGRAEVGGLVLECAEARHFSGRGPARNTTQWSSWAVLGPRHRVYFGGDTGYTAAFRAIRRRLGAFDLTLLPIGAYCDLWPDVHMTPEQAVRAHTDLCGAERGLLVPVHWATFDLAPHGWSEPAERAVAAADAAGVPIAMPRPGERVDAGRPTAVRDWWTAVR